jgi:tryptophan halogenase
MEIPESLAHRIRMFRERAHAWQGDRELFKVDSWTHVMLGQGIMPEHYHGMVTALADADLSRFLESLRATVSRTVAQMPKHQEFIDQFCKVGREIWGT